MSRIVRFFVSPIGSPVGYGILGRRHPELRDYRWIDWFTHDGGYYLRSRYIIVGTAFVK